MIIRVFVYSNSSTKNKEAFQSTDLFPISVMGYIVFQMLELCCKKIKRECASSRKLIDIKKQSCVKKTSKKYLYKWDKSINFFSYIFTHNILVPETITIPDPCELFYNNLMECFTKFRIMNMFFC